MFKGILTPALAILFFALTSIGFAQGKFGTIGKFLKPSDANILFGKVTLSIPINTGELKEALENAKDYILFAVKDNKVVITNENRRRLTRNSMDAGEKEVMFFYSKSIIASLLNYAGNSQIFLEQRENKTTTLTILSQGRPTNSQDVSSGNFKPGSTKEISSIAGTNSDVTLEFAVVCPPICFD